ncbi:MAG: bifunctional diaminohydroxyphosphoribosylaminopyrimidine deaminase/5-amino-6-(5-phosphoribosylamino)uracil reductase RibD [Kiloniellales bacterium]|nr:bifunctional diaminohydroxyphosphoribosylaminopyrimidine deaminase/5-amino-6-(5-phosphoribosylamino)uracil reductase RibD [Kiloniellales bacterium]
MRGALTLARRGLGRVAPNPAVGCVIARDGKVLGRGWTQPGGRPHAETEALARAGAAAEGATAYVTLEPCSHHGKTPPCDKALIAAGIARCVIALEDPDPRVAGQGIAHLKAAGVAVELGLCRAEAEAVNAGYLLQRREGRPLVALKLATTLDGRIATAAGESKWITGEAARARAHLLRARHDAVLVGAGTALADDPRLDVRLPGLEAVRPLRVVLDGSLRLPPSHDLVAQAGSRPSCLVTGADLAEARLAPYRDAGLRILQVGRDPRGRLDLPEALRALGGLGLTRILVEGGGRLAAGLLKTGLVDELYWFRAAKVIGGDGRPAVGELGLQKLAAAPGFARLGLETLGGDVLETFRRSA